MKRSLLIQFLGTALIAFVAGIAISGYIIPSQTESQFGGFRYGPPEPTVHTALTRIIPIITSTTQVPLLETNRNPPNYAHGDTVKISGKGFPPNRNFGLTLFAPNPYGGPPSFVNDPQLIPSSVSSDSTGRVSFSIGPLPPPTNDPTTTLLPVGTYNVQLNYQVVDASFTPYYPSTNFYYTG